MAELSHNEHSNIGEDTRSAAGYEWLDIPDDGSYGTWVHRPSLVQSDYPAQLAQERSALRYQAASFGGQNRSGLGMEGYHMMNPSGYYGFNTEVEPSRIHWSQAPSWVAPDGTVHPYNDFSSKYLT